MLNISCRRVNTKPTVYYPVSPFYLLPRSPFLQGKRWSTLDVFVPPCLFYKQSTSITLHASLGNEGGSISHTHFYVTEAKPCLYSHAKAIFSQKYFFCPEDKTSRFVWQSNASWVYLPWIEYLCIPAPVSVFFLFLKNCTKYLEKQKGWLGSCICVGVYAPYKMITFFC